MHERPSGSENLERVPLPLLLSSFFLGSIRNLKKKRRRRRRGSDEEDALGSFCAPVGIPKHPVETLFPPKKGWRENVPGTTKFFKKIFMPCVISLFPIQPILCSSKK